jgi:hypothetical protein
MKMYKTLLFCVLLSLSLAGFAQNAADTIHPGIPDLIIRTSGIMFQCKIVEVNDTLVKYMLSDQGTTGKVSNIARDEVYAISYGNGVALIMTPRLMGKDLYSATIDKLAKAKADSLFQNIVQDVVIKTNGNLFHCWITEVNDSVVLYRFPETDTTGQMHKIAKKEVYAIAYGNNLAYIVTPELMGQPAPKSEAPASCEGLQNFKKNLGKGSINVGIGFVDFYSPIKDASSYEDTKTLPTVFAGYTIKLKGHWKAGVHLGVGGNELKKSAVSDYDQLKISANIDEKFLVVGLYGRYDILDGMFKPYLKGGVDFIGTFMTTTSEITSLNGSNASLNVVANQSGIKLGLILRGGLEVYFGDNFGIYGDVGTGLSLVQFGVVFNLK